MDFRPDNSYLSKKYDGCKGFAEFTMYSPKWKVSLNIRTDPHTYSNCLLGMCAFCRGLLFGEILGEILRGEFFFVHILKGSENISNLFIKAVLSLD